MTGKPTRPVLRYHGGKWMLAPWIISHFPPHRTYVEPFGGAASVLLRKEPAYAEVYNDLSDDVVTLFRVLRDADMAQELFKLLRRTPFARTEFDAAYEATDDPVERARRLVVRSFCGHGSDACNRHRKGGFRANSNRSGTTPAHDWVSVPERCVAAAVRRLRGVVIENRDAPAVMRQHDSVETLHYVDPPYLPSTRSWQKTGRGSGNYEHELTEQDHRDLATGLKSLDGMIVVSGYPSGLYDDELFADWHRVEKEALADGARSRTEVLWLNDACWNALETVRDLPQSDFFSLNAQEQVA